MTVLVTDSSKFGRDVSAVIGPIDSVDMIVTDSDIPEVYASGFRDMGIHLLTVDV